jgi:hypothetical protein
VAERHAHLEGETVGNAQKGSLVMGVAAANPSPPVFVCILRERLVLQQKQLHFKRTVLGFFFFFLGGPYRLIPTIFWVWLLFKLIQF